jgi:hypothetical protein
MSDKKIAKIVLEIEWTSTDPLLDLPSLWDWKRIKVPMSLDRVKYIGLYSTTKPEQSDSWMGN